MTATETRPAAAPSVLSGRYRSPTIGMLLAVTLVAFEAIAVATAMPRAVASLHGLAYYGWPFTAFLVANVVGIVAGGEASDREGPRRPLLGGLAVFTAGLFVAGLAPDMWLFVTGRAVQGLGGGLIVVALYVVVGEVYEERLRPRIFAVISAAWVLPSLIGPVVSGALTQHASWRLVFLIIPPFAVLGLALIYPTTRRLPVHPPSSARLTRWRLAVLAAVGVAAMQYAGQELRWWSLLPLAAGAALLVPALRRLLPAGTARLRRGLPAIVAFRGMVAGSFFAVDSYVPLTLTHLHGYGATEAGLPLMLGSLGWSGASWWQGRNPRTPRHRLIGVGFVLVAVAAWAMVGLAVPHGPGWLAYPAWLVGGAGMGLVMPSVNVLLLEFSPAAERGKNSSALQICDVISSAIGVGAGGVLVAAAEHHQLSLRLAIALINVTMGAVALSGALLSRRARR